MSLIPYALVMGSLMYTMICTRPDIAQAMWVISRFMEDPSRENWSVVKRILRYIEGTSSVALCFEGLEFIVRVDSYFAGDLDKRKFTTNYVFTLAKREMSWLSKLFVALSTIEAECMHGNYRSLQGSYLVSKVNEGTWAQAAEDYCVLWQLECPTHWKESSLSFQDKAYRCSISLCQRSSIWRKCRHGKDSHQRQPSRYHDQANHCKQVCMVSILIWPIRNICKRNGQDREIFESTQK